MENRSMVIVTDDDGTIPAQLMLNDDQIRLLEWLMDNDWLNRDYRNFQIMGKDAVLIIL